MSTALGAAFDHHNQHRLPSKRKLDDYASFDSSLSSFDPVSMRPKPSPFPQFAPLPPPSPPPPLSPSHSHPSSSSPPPSTPQLPSSLKLQFFVRTSSRTLVIHSFPSDTVSDVIHRILNIIGVPYTVSGHLRIIYGGRQLAAASTIADCSISADSTLHLTARLRSTRFPNAWRLVDDLDKLICCLIDCKPMPREVSGIEHTITKFLNSVPTGPAVEIDENILDEYLQVFVLGRGPASLVRLYLSSIGGHRFMAERAVKLFLNPDVEFLPKTTHIQCWTIVLEFCKLLSRTSGRLDGLYVLCRSTLGELIEAHTKDGKLRSATNLAAELHPFIDELVEIVVKGLSTETAFSSFAELTDLSNFLVATRRAVRVWLEKRKQKQISRSMLYEDTTRYETWVYSLHSIYVRLLEKVDQYLLKIEPFIEKGLVHNDARWAYWSFLLTVLTNVHSFSKIYEGAPELLDSALLRRRTSVNALITRAKKNDKLRWLLKHKDVLDYESRRNLTMMLFPQGKDDYERLHEMLIDRSQLLAESFEYIGRVDAQSLHGGLFMEFKNEEATGPGVLREWFCLLCQAIFNPRNALFLPCPNDRRRFFPNPASSVDPLHLKYFGFCGRVIALALMHKVQVGVLFDRTFFTQLPGCVVTLEDIKDADPVLHMSCKKILEMDSELLDSDVLGLTFVRDIEDLGTHRAVELCPGGKDIVVNSQNREEYIRLLIQNRFMESVSQQVSHFTEGFSEILSKEKFSKLFFSSLDPEDFDRMIGGSDSIINVRDWKAHTEYNGYKAKDCQINWFWKIVEAMPEAQQRVLLFFWTSVKYLPVDGFRGLDSRLYIYKTSEPNDHLPSSHTCFYRLCLPSYSSKAMMQDRLWLITQEHVSCTFGMW